MDDNKIRETIDNSVDRSLTNFERNVDTKFANVSTVLEHLGETCKRIETKVTDQNHKLSKMEKRTSDLERADAVSYAGRKDQCPYIPEFDRIKEDLAITKQRVDAICLTSTTKKEFRLMIIKIVGFACLIMGSLIGLLTYYNNYVKQPQAEQIEQIIEKRIEAKIKALIELQ
jgi:hypothetical protein